MRTKSFTMPVEAYTRAREGLMLAIHHTVPEEAGKFRIAIEHAEKVFGDKRAGEVLEYGVGIFLQWLTYGTKP